MSNRTAVGNRTNSVLVNETLCEMVDGFSVDAAVRWLRGTFDSFDGSSRRELRFDSGSDKNEANYFSSAIQLGYVGDLPESNGSSVSKPLYVAAIEMKRALTERTSRLVQFNYAKKLLKTAVARGEQGVRGIPSQGLFFFYDQDGTFRLSLVSGTIEGRSFKFNSAKRQSFYAEAGKPNNILKRRLNRSLISFAAVKDAFSVDQLTKEFYSDLFNWYEWAMERETNVTFPNDTETDKDDRKQISEALIRLITRLMFTWFIREKGLVPRQIFDKDEVKKIIKDFKPGHMKEDSYYRCVLQNLFFATFNCPVRNRKFVKVFQGKSEEHGVKTCYRYSDEFVSPESFRELMRKIPFLNCALFDCLDRAKRPEEGRGEMLIDGFSQKSRDRMAHVPNGLFFDEDRGLIKLFNQYEFTVNENDADDSDVALDPELLGKVFENLLGAFNPETEQTARKATGSFYTPREIVDYMVEESLKNYIKGKVATADDNRLADLFDRSKAASREKTMFSKDEKDAILDALYSCKVLDPACGSGAFPMGMLHCMVRLLARLDPDCIRQRDMLLARYRSDVRNIDPALSPAEREERRQELEDLFKEENLNPDYARKLYLIENCIYGVDIQPIATQISKLRFFISLLCDQFRATFDLEADNSGLLSLPNLEAKFVCANTLISLPKIESDELALSTGNVATLREELQANRHKIFKARTAATKKKYKDRDVEIRKEIESTVHTVLGTPDARKVAMYEKAIAEAERKRQTVAEPKWQKISRIVKRDLFSEQETITETVDLNKSARDKFDDEIESARRALNKELAKARQSKSSALDEYARAVAGWDPYDQNAISPFFDPEWMFNISKGFDIVIGNPPYGAKLSDVDKKYCSEYYVSAKTIPGQQKGSLDTFSLFVEKALNSTTLGGNTIFILPMSIVSSGSMVALHKLLFSQCATIVCSSYAVRPQPVFENAVVNTTIFGFVKTGTDNESVLTTKMYRKGEGFDLAALVRGLEFAESRPFLLSGRIPKIGTKVECSILEKMFKCQPLSTFVDSRGRPVYYRTSGGRYFKVVTNYSTGSNKEKPIYLRKDLQKPVVACLSSSLGFWFYQIYSNNLDWKSEEILSFPLPLISDEVADELNRLCKKYTDDIERHANKREVSQSSKYTMDSFKEYKIGYSKKIIDEIDDFIGPLYGLTKEEIEFIKNYELEFRMADYMSPEELAKIRGTASVSGTTVPKRKSLSNETSKKTTTVTSMPDDEELE